MNTSHPRKMDPSVEISEDPILKYDVIVGIWITVYN
jgi:hypothetical protein